MKWLSEPSCQQNQKAGADAKPRNTEWATIYCPHCVRPLAILRTDVDRCRTLICEECGRRACVHVYANRFWTVSAC